MARLVSYKQIQVGLKNRKSAQLRYEMTELVNWQEGKM